MGNLLFDRCVIEEKKLSYLKQWQPVLKGYPKRMSIKTNLVLVVSSTGPLQDGLLALLTTMPTIGAVLVAEDSSSALRLVENHQPALVILDLPLLPDLEIIQQIRERCQNVQLIGIAEESTQQAEANASGADQVLLKGFAPHKLVAMVDELFYENRHNLADSHQSAGGLAPDSDQL